MVYDTYGVYLKKSIAKSLKVFNKKYLEIIKESLIL